MLADDRSGITLKVNQALAMANINVIDMQTFITSVDIIGDNVFNKKFSHSEKNRYDLEQLEI